MAQKGNSQPGAGFVDLPGDGVGKGDVGQEDGGELGEEGGEGDVEEDKVFFEVACGAEEADEHVGWGREEDGGVGGSGSAG